MKMRITALLTALIMLIGCAAMAEGITLTPVLSGMAAVNTVTGMSLLRVTDSATGLQGLITTAGEAVTGYVYTFLAELDFGYFATATVTEGVNITGMIDATGRQVAAEQYISVNVLSDRWGIGAYGVEADATAYDIEINNYYDGSVSYYAVETIDVIDLTTGTVVGNLPYSQCYGGEANHDYLILQDADGVCTVYDSTLTAVDYQVSSVYDDIYEEKDGSIVCMPTGEVIATGYDYGYLQQLNGQDVLYVTAYTEDYESMNGVLDMSGNVIVPLSSQDYYDFGYDLNTIQTYENDKYGLYDVTTGTQLVANAYDDIQSSYYSIDEYVNNGYVCVENNDLVGFVDVNGNVTCELKYDASNFDLAGCVMIFSNDDGTSTIVAADGVETTVPYEVNSYRAGGNGILLPVEDADYNYGLIDWHGNEILPCTYESSITVTCDSAAVIVYENDSYTLYTVTGNR